MQYWIDTADGPAFDTPEAAIEDWRTDHDTIPSTVWWSDGDREGTIGVTATDWQSGPYSLTAPSVR
jgi:hypothetical protein